MKRGSKRTFLLVAVTLVALIVPIVAASAQRGAAPAGNPNPPTSPVTGNAANGKALYFANTCYGCHGYNGETGRAFVGNWSANLATEENFIRFLRGRANVAPVQPRSEERRVGKECRCGWARDHGKEKV